MADLSEDTIKAIEALVDARNVDIEDIVTEGHHGLPESVPVLLDPKNGRALSLRPLIEEWRQKPARKSGTAVVTTLESFIDLVERHKTEHSAIFADTDWQKPSFSAVIDYHEAAYDGEADNGRHRIRYDFPLSEEWQAWVGTQATRLGQQEFAEFIEDRIGEIAAPHEDEITYWQEKLGGKVAFPNEIQALSRGLKLSAETKLRSNITLASGEGELTWEEEHRDQHGQKLIVPSLFIIRLPVFFRGEAVRVPVRLRYRVAAGTVTWFYQLYRPDTFVTEQIVLDLDRAAGATELPKFEGAPEMAAG